MHEDEIPKQSIPPIIALLERVQVMPHVLKQGGGDPVKALGAMLDLLETPNNIDALWVWSAFAQSFGQGDTWQAERALNTLLNWTATRQKFVAELESQPDAKHLIQSLADAEQHCFIMLEHVLANFKKWPDVGGFVQHKRSLQPSEPAEPAEVQS